eukprot:1052818-Pelagomonas_calceolata.AAC.3
MQSATPFADLMRVCKPSLMAEAVQQAQRAGLCYTWLAICGQPPTGTLSWPSKDMQGAGPARLCTTRQEHAKETSLAEVNTPLPSMQPSNGS